MKNMRPGGGVTDGFMIFLPFSLFQSFNNFQRSALHPYLSVANLLETWFCVYVIFPHSSSNVLHPYLHPSVANLAAMWEMDLPFLLIPLALSPC